jgi:hypothetical protein
MLEKEIAAFRQNAEDCLSRSKVVSDPATKAEWLDLTTQWHWLATLASGLVGNSPEATVTLIKATRG